MATERRFLLSWAVADKSGDISFLNISTTIEGDLERGIESLKKRIVEDFRAEGVGVEQPVLLTALQLDSIRPPDWVQLQIMVRRSMEQVVKDYHKGKPTHPGAIQDIEDWLIAIKEADE